MLLFPIIILWSASIQAYPAPDYLGDYITSSWFIVQSQYGNLPDAYCEWQEYEYGYILIVTSPDNRKVYIEWWPLKPFWPFWKINNYEEKFLKNFNAEVQISIFEANNLTSPIPKQYKLGNGENFNLHDLNLDRGKLYIMVFRSESGEFLDVQKIMLID